MFQDLRKDGLSDIVSDIQNLKPNDPPICFDNKDGNKRKIEKDESGNFIFITTIRTLDKESSTKDYVTIYSAEGKIISKEDNPMSSTMLGTKILIEYDDNENPIKATTTFISSFGYKTRQCAVMGRKSFTVTNDKGETILIYKDEKWYDAKNHEVDDLKVNEILDEYNNKKITLTEVFN